jgi:hypothetical protein
LFLFFRGVHKSARGFHCTIAFPEPEGA